MISLRRICLWAVALGALPLTWASSPSPPLQGLQVTLRGKKYEINQVTTVQDLKDKVLAAASSSSSSKDHHILFDGKKLDAGLSLRQAGVTDGAALNMVPAMKKKKSSSSSSKSSSSGDLTTSAASAEASTTSTSASADAMREYLQQSGIDSNQLDELMKSMGGGAGAGGMPDMKESLDMMTNMMKSPIFQEYVNNPEMLEQSRQMILNNPMLKSLMAGMPGMDELLNDATAWREAMQAAANLYQNMDPAQLQAMMESMPPGGPPGMGGMGGMGGMFDGNLDAATTAALDELEEDD